MLAGAKRAVKAALEAATRPLGIKISRRSHDWEDTEQFIPLDETLRKAEQAGMSVCDYIDTVMNRIPGATQTTIDNMAEAGVFDGKIETVVEIGPGSGRYLEKTLGACAPLRYEIYETAGPWVDYLTGKYKIISQPTDGKTLSSTPDRSADLVHAHKVFNGVNFMTTMRYWREMTRITKPGGHVVFDIITERCLNEAGSLDKWIDSGLNTGPYPIAIPAKVAADYFQAHEFTCERTFFSRLSHGRTELFVFRRTPDNPRAA
jgi:hypothetical protein